ncbi:MAG: hypothetical protein H0U55_04035 [Rubrobacteraceae bacterium]|nr:hypothetical protein [Rubrobacteraceae bacterium]
MNRKNATTEFMGRRIGDEHPPIATEPTRASESEEWAWMVDEDPAFYLSQQSRAENAGG